MSKWSGQPGETEPCADDAPENGEGLRAAFFVHPAANSAGRHILPRDSPPLKSGFQ